MPGRKTDVRDAEWIAELFRHGFLRASCIPPRPYRRLAARRGAKRAFVAVGHTILGMVYAVLTTGRPFDDLGVTYFDRRDADHVRRRPTRRLEALGYVVTVAPRGAWPGIFEAGP